MATKGTIALGDVTSLVKARNPIIWIVTREEGRVEELVSAAMGKLGYTSYTWDIGQGVCDMEGRSLREGSAQPTDMLQFISDRATGRNKSPGVQGRAAWLMRDLPAWVTAPLGLAGQRKLRNLARLLPNVEADRHQVVFILTPQTDLPPELMGCTQVLDWPLPDGDELGAIYDAQKETLTPATQELCTPTNRQEAIDAALGLSSDEATNCFSHALIVSKRFDPIVISKEKKRIITRERVLDWYEPLPGGLGDVGGLENLKEWLLERSTAYTLEARAYGLPTPRGVVIAGMSGCGKSMTAKAAATTFGCPLLRLDLGALKSKYVGESEANLRKAFQVIDTIGKCVILLDEVEKALSGGYEGASDGGVSQDALGSILTWMQERKNEAFIMATCNDPRRLPPEFLRKERFDEVFFVDLPTTKERVAILEATLRRLKRDEELDLETISDVCNNFTGAEVANIVPSAMFKAFRDGARPITTTDIIAEAGRVVRLMDTMAAKMGDLREWSSRAVPASTPEIDTTSYVGNVRRGLDAA